jgi:hypothetical protein
MIFWFLLDFDYRFSLFTEYFILNLIKMETKYYKLTKLSLNKKVDIKSAHDAFLEKSPPGDAQNQKIGNPNNLKFWEQ